MKINEHELEKSEVWSLAIMAIVTVLIPVLMFGAIEIWGFWKVMGIFWVGIIGAVLLGILLFMVGLAYRL